MFITNLLINCEDNLNELLEKGCYKEFKTKLRKALVRFKRERSSPYYLRLWLYYATLIQNPIPIYQHLFQQRIGTTFALLYEDIAFYYLTMGKQV
ncbi:hypothetical protein BJ944DRAFT_261641 [Cunninghamella echinulata]|nr:hypothetical protein BJ944DRAFT_261641 [Cunninghamella echinulata]